MRRPLRMPTLDRYVARTVVQNFLFALLTLVAIFFVINATEELQRVDAGSYGVRQAMWFVILMLPNEIYALFPASALLGNVIGLGGLAHRNELLAMASAGVSRTRLLWSVLQFTAVLVVAGALFSEVVAAPLAYRAHTERAVALSGERALTMTGGIWTRAGSSFVNMRTLLPSGVARDVYVYDFDAQHRLRRFTHAQSATYTDRQWILENLVDKTIGDNGLVTEQVASRPVPIELNPRQLGLMQIPADELSLSDLYRAIGAARRQGESAEPMELAWWQRVTMPIVTVVMSFLAAALVLVSPRWTTLGRRILVGGLLGIGFQMFNQTFASFGLVYDLAPWLSALLPTSLALAFGMWCLSHSPL